MRYGIFVHEPDGDMGYGRIVGSFKTPGAAAIKASQIEAKAGDFGATVECLVVSVLPGATPPDQIIIALTDGD